MEKEKKIEENLIDSKSQFYLGSDYEKILDYSAKELQDSEGNKDTARFIRLTNEKDRAYSYLYAALMTKQIQVSWQKASFPIDDNIGVVTTLYNIGFQHSNPNANPKVGGARINLSSGEKSYDYSFGELAELFYESDELVEIFPK